MTLPDPIPAPLADPANVLAAVDLGAEGLVAPVIKHAEKLSVGQLADAISDIAQRSRSNRLKADDFAGGTYTLSNSGVFGTLITAPIINQPQVAILSTDGVRKKPVVVETSEGDSIAIRPVGVLALGVLGLVPVSRWRPRLHGAPAAAPRRATQGRL